MDYCFASFSTLIDRPLRSLSRTCFGTPFNSSNSGEAKMKNKIENSRLELPGRQILFSPGGTAAAILIKESHSNEDKLFVW